MLPKLHEIPLARPALSLISGVLIGDIFQFTHSPFPLLVSCAIVYATVYLFFSKSNFTPIVLGFLLWIGCALLGATLLFQQRSQINNPTPGEIIGKARIENVLKHKKNISTCEVSLALVENDKTIQYRFNLLYFDSIPFPLNEGDIVYVEGEITDIKEPLNPFEFDGRGFYLQKGISGQLVADSLRWVTSAPSALDNLKRIGRAHIGEAVKSVKNKNVQALLVAMITGDKSELNNEIKSDFSNAGIMHLLAVSGLHVGLVGWLPLVLLQRCGQRLWLKTVTGIAGLLVVWLFAIFTGLGPSAFRAALMFSLVAIALFFRFRSSSPNMLCAAAIIVLLYNPTELFSIGFQLSFCAVAGISLGSRIISGTIPSRYNWINKLTGAASVSIAAQGATTPFTLFHFGVFPIYFLPANLIAVPLGTVLMYSILLLLMPDPSEYLHDLVGYVAELVGLLLLATANFIAALPLAQIQVAQWGFLNSLLLGVGFIVALSASKGQFFRLTTAILIMIIGLTFQRNFKEEYIVFFSDKKQSIGIKSNEFSMVFGSTKKLPFELQGWTTRQGAEFISIYKDTLLVLPHSVIAKKGNQIFTNFVYAGDNVDEKKKYPIAISEWDKSEFPRNQISTNSIENIWQPDKGAYVFTPN